MKHHRHSKGQMMNGNILQTLREMAGKEKLDPEIAQPMILGVLADIYQALCDLKQERETDWREMEKNREHYKEERLAQLKLIEQTNESIAELKNKVEAIENSMRLLEYNPAIKAGNFVSEHPKMTKVLVMLGIITLSLWMIPGIRLWFFSDILRLPNVVIDFLMAYLTPTPIIK